MDPQKYTKYIYIYLNMNDSSQTSGPTKFQVHTHEYTQIPVDTQLSTRIPHFDRNNKIINFPRSPPSVIPMLRSLRTLRRSGARVDELIQRHLKSYQNPAVFEKEIESYNNYNHHESHTKTNRRSSKYCVPCPDEGPKRCRCLFDGMHKCQYLELLRSRNQEFGG